MSIGCVWWDQPWCCNECGAKFDPTVDESDGDHWEVRSDDRYHNLLADLLCEECAVVVNTRLNPRCKGCGRIEDSTNILDENGVCLRCDVGEAVDEGVAEYDL